MAATESVTPGTRETMRSFHHMCDLNITSHDTAMGGVGREVPETDKAVGVVYVYLVVERYSISHRVLDSGSRDDGASLVGQENMPQTISISRIPTSYQAKSELGG